MSNPLVWRHDPADLTSEKRLAGPVSKLTKTWTASSIVSPFEPS